MSRRAALIPLLAFAVACGTSPPPAGEERLPDIRDTSRIAIPPPPPVIPDRDVPLVIAPDFSSGRLVRVALFTDVDRITLGGTGSWLLYDDNGTRLQFRARASDAWTIKAEKGQLRAERDDGERAARRPAPFIARAEAKNTFITVNGRPFRGEVLVRPGDHGVVVIDRLGLEEYLRGVVPLEIGKRAEQELAAVEAQAIAARSYATAHVRADAPRGYDLLSTVSDQVYGGVNAEQPLADAAIAATHSLVLTWQGRVIAAPYSASCGGHTAGADETWHQGDAAYLRGISDRVKGGGDRFYCEIAPHFRWMREYDRRELDAVLAVNLHGFAPVQGKVGIVTDVSIDGHTPSGRVAALRIVTDKDTYTVRGNDIRFVLRNDAGEILPSTMFAMEAVHDGVGRVSALRFTGTGNGHGVGMCQWGAIGRARDGANARAILRAYYPGAAVTALPE